MTEVPERAILQRDGRTLAIVPRVPAGLITPEQLESIAAIARRYHVALLKMTSGQRIALVGIEPTVYTSVCRELNLSLGQASEPCVHYVQTCAGTQWCKYGLQDSIAVGLELEARLVGRATPAKLKLGVSGCTACCAESYLRDIGLIGTKKGWIVTFGGNSGASPRIADVIAKHVTREQAIAMVDALLAMYVAHGQTLKRTAKFASKVGVEWIKQQLGL